MSKRKDFTDKELRFVEEYLIDLNGAQAAIRAGYSEKSARFTASELLTKDRIADLIAQKMAERSKRTGVSADRVIRELARIAFSNMKDFSEWGPNGITLKYSAEMTEDDGACVAELTETVTERGGSRRFKLHPKLPALESLCKHLGLFAKDNDQKDAGLIEKAKELSKLGEDELVKQIEEQLQARKLKLVQGGK